VLLVDPPDRDLPARGDRYGRAENLLGHEDALSVVAQSTVPEIGDDHFRFVEPVVDALVAFNLAAPLPNAGECVMIRMCHDRPAQ